MVGYVEPNGPADKAGLKTGDQITDIYSQGYCFGCLSIETEEAAARHEILDTQDLRDTAAKEQGYKVTVEYVRKGVPHYIKVDLRSYDEVQQSLKTDSPKGYLGIQPYDYTIQRSTWSAPIVGAGLIKQYSSLTYQALGGSVANLFKGHAKEASENVAGPIGIFVVLKDGASFGLSYILLIIALLSLTLAIMNTLPIPALDGGKLFVMLLFRFINKPLTQKLEERIHGTGFAVLMALFVLITVVDIGRFF
jgi:regulator of sigma E protease